MSVPGSKSITARALVCAALARGRSVLRNLCLGDDGLAMISCLRELGIEIKLNGDSACVEGCGGKIPARKARLNAGSSGTAARFVAALAAFSRGEYLLDCSVQMKKRPMAPLLGSLKECGAEISGDNFPLTIKGAPPAEFKLSADITQSSQFLSALMLAAPLAAEPLEISFSGRDYTGYAEMTAKVMRDFGGAAERRGNAYIAGGGYSGREYYIEPDLSAAGCFYAANRILGTDIRVENLPATGVQGDFEFIRFIRDFNGGRADASAFSDQTLNLAAVAPYLGFPTLICGVPHLRWQECDRLNAIQVNLSAMGVKCKQVDGGIEIYPAQPKPARIKTFGDHRVAMAFALTGLRADGIVIENAGTVSKTFPGYFGKLDGLCAALTGSTYGKDNNSLRPE